MSACVWPWLQSTILEVPKVPAYHETATAMLLLSGSPHRESDGVTLDPASDSSRLKSQPVVSVSMAHILSDLEIGEPVTSGLSKARRATMRKLFGLLAQIVDQSWEASSKQAGPDRSAPAQTAVTTSGLDLH